MRETVGPAVVCALVDLVCFGFHIVAAAHFRKELCPLLITILGNPTQIDAAHARSGSTSHVGGLLGRGLASASGEQVIFGAPEVARAAQK